MKLTDIHPIKLQEISNDALKELWKKINLIWEVENVNKEEIISRAIFIINEFSRRKLDIEETGLLKAADEWKKRHSEAEVNCKVWKITQTETSPVFNYEFAFEFAEQDIINPESIIEIQGKKYIKAGRTHETSIKCEVGDIIAVRFSEADFSKNSETGAVNIELQRGFVTGRKENTEAAHKISEVIEKAKDAGIIEIDTEKTTAEEKEASLEEALRQPFGSQGGKKFMASRLVRMIPEHKTYVEAFMGGGAVFWKKNKSEKEVINDLDPRIVRAYKFIQDITEEQWTELKKMYWTANKKVFGEILKDFKNSDGTRWFHDFIYLKQFSNLGEMKSFENRDLGTTWNGVNNLMRMKERLKNVEILNKDYKTVIKMFDAEDTFFYLDPPYPNAAYVWNSMPKESDIEEAISGIKGKFLLSYELTKAFGKFNKTTIELMSIASPQQKKVNYQKKELLVSNYKIIRNTKYLNEALVKDGYDWFDIFHECFVANGYAKDWLELDSETKKKRIQEALKNFDFKMRWGMEDDILRASMKKGFRNITSVLKEEFVKNKNIFIKHPIDGNAELCAYNDFVHEYFYEAGSSFQRVLYRKLDSYIQEHLSDTIVKCMIFNRLFEDDLTKHIQAAVDKPHDIVEIIDLILDGDIVKVETAVSGSPDWFAIKPIDQTPYVLTKEAVSKKWIPKAGESALPKRIEKAIPENHRYWLAESKKKSLKMRDSLYEAIMKKEIDIKEEGRHRRDQCMNCAEPPTLEILWAEGMAHAWFCDKHFKEWEADHKDDINSIKKIKDGKAAQKFRDNTNPNIKESQFALQHHWKKGFLAEHWDLRIDTGIKPLIYMILEYSPLKENNISMRMTESKDKSWMTKGLKIERINEEIPSYIQMLDTGPVVIQEQAETLLKLDFKGKKLLGSWIAEKDASSSGKWILKAAERKA